MSHFIRKDPDPNPSPEEGGVDGTSLVVWQFFELVNGTLPVHKPRNEFRTIKVVLDVRYCLRCCGERRHDVWFGRTFGAHAQDFSMGRCRCCGEEVRYG